MVKNALVRNSSHAFKGFYGTLITAMARAGSAPKIADLDDRIKLSHWGEAELGDGRSKHGDYGGPNPNGKVHGRTVIRDQQSAPSYQFCRLEQ